MANTHQIFLFTHLHVQMVELLLDRGAGANTTDDKYGWTALMLATHQR